MPYPLRLLSRTSWVVAAMLGTVFCVMTVNLVSVSKSLAQEGKPPAQENEKPKTEAPVADDQKPGKEDKPATEPAKPAQGEDRAAATRGQSRPLPATPVDDRSARTAAKSKGDITFDDIKFGIEKDGLFERKMLTEDIENLHKKTVRLRGYILPASVFQQTGIKKFVLVRDNQECCFGPGAALFDCVMIEMAEGKAANFTTRPVAVRGTFMIDSESYQYPDGGHYAIYKMLATEVK
jgi:hypothetical protein